MFAAAVGRVADRVGRRGAVLSLKGLMALLYGYAQLIAPAVDTRGMHLLLQLMPPRCWAWAWMTAGSVALVSAWLRQGWDWLGFAGIYLVAAPWSLSYLASWGLYDNARGWIAALIWAAFGGVAAICTGWAEPPRAHRGDAHER